MTSDRLFAQVDAAIVPRFADIATFMRTRRVDPSREVDIGLVGVPFDLGVNYRSGARQGPAGVREASRLIRRLHPTLGISPFEICNVADLGDAPVNPLSLEQSMASIQGFFETLSELEIVPIAVGGDHTIPLPILRALARDRSVGVLHFDAHADTLDVLCGTKINHATFLRRAHEEGLVDPNRVLQIGLRGSRFGTDDIQYGYDVGYTIITMVSTRNSVERRSSRPYGRCWATARSISRSTSMALTRSTRRGPVSRRSAGCRLEMSRSSFARFVARTWSALISVKWRLASTRQVSPA